MSEKAFLVLFICLAIAVFVGLWFLACRAISSLSGWKALATRYPLRGAPRGRRFWMQSGRVGKAYYKNCLVVRSATDGLYLAMLFIFRPGHPPIFIPWEEIEVKESSGKGIFGVVTCEVGKPAISGLSLAKRAFEARNEE